MTTKLTMLTIQQRLAENEPLYTVSGTYKTSKDKLTFHHAYCGHDTVMTWSDFQSGRRCYYCNARYWDTEKFTQYVHDETNGEYAVMSDYVGSNQPITLHHNVCGHDFTTRPSAFISLHRRCSFCSVTRKLTADDFIQRVHAMLDETYVLLSPYTNMMGKVRMRHETCGFEFVAYAQNLVDGVGCPNCSAMRQPTPAEFRDEIAELVGDEYTVLSDYTRALDKVLMRHAKCGNEFMITPNSFKNGTRCPRCRDSKGEQAIRRYLTEHGFMFEQQWQIKIPGRPAPLRADFYLEQEHLVIEFDGIQHYEPVEFFGGEDGLKSNQERDALKDKWCAEHGITVWRIRYDEFDNLTTLLSERLEK